MPIASRRGWWVGGKTQPLSSCGLRTALCRLGDPVVVVDVDGSPALVQGGHGELERGTSAGPQNAKPLLAYAPRTHPSMLGSPQFRDTYGLELAYGAGAMAGGIASADLVEAMGRAGMLGVYGAAGLGLGQIEHAIERIQTRLGAAPHGFNLIHSPYEPRHEQATVDLYLRTGVRTVSASAFLGLTIPLLQYRLTGIHARPDGRVVVPNRVLGKVSRPEVARPLLCPAPDNLLAELVGRGVLTEAQANMAKLVPVVQALTVEADSGGHTDNQPALSALPTMLALRDEVSEFHRYAEAIPIGAAGGIATPTAAAAAFAMGADYILTGSVNQACVEAGTSDLVKQMLAKATPSDVTMAPAADMFEMGVQLQVLRAGTMFPMRAAKLYRLYRDHDGLEQLNGQDRATLEKTIFRASVDEVWSHCVRFWTERDPGQLRRAKTDPKHKMALTFRWYLGQSSRWATTGDADRSVDMQIWCGPAMGAFNAWTRGSFMEAPSNRRVADVASNIMVGAAISLRALQVRAQGVHIPHQAIDLAPRPPGLVEELLT